jgi:hypothetical protein
VKGDRTTPIGVQVSVRGLVVMAQG